jgi:hypothetical protein
VKRLRNEEEIPLIIQKLNNNIQLNNNDFIEYEHIIELLKEHEIETSKFMYNNTISFFNDNLISEKCYYSEEELFYLLDNIYHLSYIKNGVLINNPIIEVW